MPRLNLTLDKPLEQEEDISEASPYLGILQTPASSTTSSTEGSTTTATPTPARPFFPQGFNVPHIQHSISRKKSLGELSSPSALPPKLKRPGSLSRSQTLTRVPKYEGRKRRRQAELDRLDLTLTTLEKIRRWIIGIAIIDFDVDDGPVLDGIYPPSIILPAEAENLAFSSFPDSLQFDQGSQNHSFRIREQISDMSTEKRPATQDGFIYGYSHFTQKRDSNSKRGYEQRSAVILTQHQYPAFFSTLISIFGPLFHKHGIPILEAACQNIATWRDPTPGATLELGFLGSVLRLLLPLTPDEQQFVPLPSNVQKYDPMGHIAASSPPLSPPPILLFEAALTQLWSIWECLVLCEPLLVFGSSPAQTSQAIWWLRDLLRPIPLAGDFRPYFTMQDGDHPLLVNRLPPKPGILLGVTNPFFEKSCEHWPHILSLGRRRGNNTATTQKSGSGVIAGPVPGWKSKIHKRYISKDRVLLKQLENVLHKDADAQLATSLALRQHFQSRTTELILPFARYLNTLIPSPNEVAKSSTTVLRLKPFNSANFFLSLKLHGSTLPFRSTSQRTEFYQRLLKSPWFGLWLAQQEKIVEAVLKEKRTI